ncbi:MAG: hypothetical protein ABIV48_13200, partial [Pyrinomonadaceae bacterium]
EFMSSLPLTAYVVVLVGYFLGSFAGGYIVTKMTMREGPGVALPIFIGVILTLIGIVNFFVMLPGQPVWFTTVALLTFIPVALLGHKMAR